MGLVERAKNICLRPKSEWTAIAGESTPSPALITGYVLPLAAISALAGLIGGAVVGRTLPFVGTYRLPIGTALGLAAFHVGMAVVSVVVLSLIINALAPRFAGKRDPGQALKLAAYSYTPAWLAGVLRIVPGLGLLVLLGALFGLYLLYVGLPRLMKSPEDRSLGYTAVVVVCAIGIGIVIAVAGGVLARPAFLAERGLASFRPGRSSSGEVQLDRDSPMGKLQAMADKMEDVGKRMDAAEKRGDSREQMKVAMEGLGTILGGGKRYAPLAVDQLKGFLPDSLAGLKRTRGSSEKNGIGGIMVSRSEATYGDGSGRSIDLEVTDTGGASGLVGLASWANVESEKEDDAGVERVRKEAGRYVHEKISRTGANEFGVVLGERFVVTARGHGVTFDELKAGVGSLDLARLESMRDAGAQE